MVDNSKNSFRFSTGRLWGKVRKVGIWSSVKTAGLWGALQIKTKLQRPQDLTSTVFLCGSPRSGTTWVAELLTAGTGYHALIEPLRINSVRRAAEVGFDWRTMVIPGTSWPKGEEFLHDLFTGRFSTPSMLVWVSPSVLFDCRGWLVKSVRANRMLPWLVTKFPLRGYILLIRHPCAVVASQLRDPRFLLPDLSMVEYQKFFDIYPEFRTVAETCHTPEEIYALRWCMDQHIPFSSNQQHRWLVVRYEDLVQDGEAQLERIFRFLRLPISKAPFLNLNSPSRETAKWSAIRTGSDPLKNWETYLETVQIERIKKIVQEFNLTSLYPFD